MLVGFAGLSLNTVLGVVRAYLPRLECSEIVGSNDLDLDSVFFVVQTDDLESFEVRILGCVFVRFPVLRSTSRPRVRVSYACVSKIPGAVGL